MFDVILLQVVHQVSPIALRGKRAGLKGVWGEGWHWKGQRGGSRLERKPGDTEQAGGRATGRGRGVHGEKSEGVLYSGPCVVLALYRPVKLTHEVGIITCILQKEKPKLRCVRKCV